MNLNVAFCIGILSFCLAAVAVDVMCSRPFRYSNSVYVHLMIFAARRMHIHAQEIRLITGKDVWNVAQKEILHDVFWTQRIGQCLGNFIRTSCETIRPKCFSPTKRIFIPFSPVQIHFHMPLRKLSTIIVVVWHPPTIAPRILVSTNIKKVHKFIIRMCRKAGFGTNCLAGKWEICCSKTNGNY